MRHSPYCIPVRRVLEAYKISYTVNAIPAWDRRELINLTDGTYYQVPVIETDGRIIYETPEDPLAVAHFLDSEYCEGTLFPADCAGLHELIIEHIENTLEGMGFKLSDPLFVEGIKDIGERYMVIRHKERSFGRGCVEEWKKHAAGLAEVLETALAPYETRLGTVPYLFGDAPVYADYALFGVVENAEFGGAYELDSSLANLKLWQSELANYIVDR